MPRTRFTIDTGPYTRAHGHAPWSETKAMWTVTLDDDPNVIVRYGRYKDVMTWAKAVATTTITLWP